MHGFLKLYRKPYQSLIRFQKQVTELENFNWFD